MPDNIPKKKTTTKPESKPLRRADYEEYLSRKRAYDDSTNTYNDSIKNHAKLLSIGMKQIASEPAGDEVNDLLINGGVSNKVTSNGKTVTLPQRTNAKIAPVTSNTYRDSSGKEVILPIYKAPTQRVAYTETVERTAPEKAKASNTQRIVGGYKKVGSSDPKYKGLREYATYKQNSDSLAEDKFKKKVIETRNKALTTPRVKTVPKKKL